MILHAIELNHVGRFRESVRLGPFTSGLNVLAAPNEFGKSTALQAAARALFDRHGTKGEEMKGLQPAGTALAPRIAVEFETRAGRFRIEKTFLVSPRSLLSQWQSNTWQLLAEADAADQRVQSLLQSSLPGRGATKPEHWGFLGFLWARQGEPAAWPGLDDAAVGQRIRARLARVELDPVIEQLRTRLAAVADTIFTGRGQPKANGPLDTAEQELAVLEAELAALRQTRATLDVALTRYQQAEAAVAQLEKELTERERTAALLREQTLTVERLRGDLGARQQALDAAQEKLNTVAADAATFANLGNEAALTQAGLVRAEAAAASADQCLTQLRTRLIELQAQRPPHEARLNTLRTEAQRTQSLLRLRQFTETASILARQVAKAETVAVELNELETRKSKLAALTPAKLRKLEELFEQTRTRRAQLQALGLALELTPERDTTVGIHDGVAARQQSLVAGQTTRLHSPQTLDLQLEGWGRLVVRSGARETQDAAQQLQEAETTLREALENAEVASLEAARDAVAERKHLDAQIKAITTALGSHLGDHATLDTLREAADGAVRRAETLVATLQPTATEQARSQTDLETAEAQFAESVPAEEHALACFDQQLDQVRADEHAAIQSAQKATQSVNDQRRQLHVLEAQRASLTTRYSEGLDAAKTAAQVAFTQAEARVVALKTELPPDFEKLPERNKRAAAALQQLTNELQSRRAERDQAQGTLETLGGQGLYSRETELEEKKAEVILRRDAARTKGWCARLAHDLIEYRKQAATKAVLTPLEQRLTAAFAELTGDVTRRVFLDEHLQIAGIGPTRDAVHAFDNLSQGAKEQLLLCLRLAVAQELATDEPQVLILDDVLVNTDAVRQERVLDLLGTCLDRIQILILTCHPDRYRGAGVVAGLTAAEG